MTLLDLYLVSASEAIKKFGDRSVCYFVDDLVVLR